MGGKHSKTKIERKAVVYCLPDIETMHYTASKAIFYAHTIENNKFNRGSFFPKKAQLTTL